MAEIHYVYELKRITPGPGPSRYIGVRTAANSEPENDDYWSSSEKIAKEIGRGVKFQKKVIRKFSSREDAELFEAELHWQHMVGKNPHFYNVTSQLIEGALEQLLPRERYRSPDGEHLWFKAGSEPDGWVRDPARWAQFKDLSHKDGLRQQAGFPQTYEGLELPEWEFHKYYPDEMAFSSSQPRHCHEPYIKLDYRNDVKDCAYFPKGCQPAGWVSGFAPSFRVSGEPPAGWHLLFHISPASQHVNSAYLPRGASLSGWVDVEMYEQMSRDGRISRNSVHDVNNELRYLCDIANDDEDLRNRLRSYRNEKIDSITDYKFYEKIDLLEIDEKSLFHVKDIIGDSRIKVLLHRAFDASRCDDDETEEIIKRQKLFGFFLDNGSELTVEEWAQTLSKLDVSEADKQLALEMVMMQLGVTSIPAMPGSEENAYKKNGADMGVDHREKLPDPELPDAAVEHISQMLMLAKSKHQEAMALLGTSDPNALSRLREVLRLLEEVELLADDATSYVEADVMKAAIKDLHFQQAAVQAAIARLENVKVQSPWATPWPWFTLIVLALLIAQVVG